MRTELTKIGNPYRHDSMDRTAYYTRVQFRIEGKLLNPKIKVDTGACYTIIGLGEKTVKDYKDTILVSGVDGVAYDASGNELKLKGYVVHDFKLTEDIIIPELLLFFSEDIGEKAVLGMDILSLFDFQYIREKNLKWGTFWINNPEDVLHIIQENKKKRGLDYINPGDILEIGDISVDDVKITSPAIGCLEQLTTASDGFPCGIFNFDPDSKSVDLKSSENSKLIPLQAMTYLSGVQSEQKKSLKELSKKLGNDSKLDWESTPSGLAALSTLSKSITYPESSKNKGIRLSEIAEYIVEKYPNCRMVLNNDVQLGCRDAEYEEGLITPLMDFFSNELVGLCGCGCPEQTTEMIRKVLYVRYQAKERDLQYPLVKLKYKDEVHIDDDDDELQGGMLQFVLYMLDNKGLLEHGGNIWNCWLTELGEMYLVVLDAWHEWYDN